MTRLWRSKSAYFAYVSLLTLLRVIESPPAGPTLLTIPLEIRYQIFEELMKDILVEVTHRAILTPISWRKDRKSIVPYYWALARKDSNPFDMCADKNQWGAVRDTAERFPRLGHSIVMTCSQLHKEALFLPWQLCTFHFNHPKDFNLFCKNTTKEERGAVRSMHICIKHNERGPNTLRLWKFALKNFRSLDYSGLRHLSIHLREWKQVEWVNCALEHLVRLPPRSKRDAPPLYIPPLRSTMVRADFPKGRPGAQVDRHVETARAFEEIAEKILLEQPPDEDEEMDKDMADELARTTKAFTALLESDPHPISWSNRSCLTGI